MKKLKESVEKNEVDSFHSHLFELENTLQNFDRMKELLQEGGVLCYAAYIGSNPVAATLIQKEVGKEKTYLYYWEYSCNIT